MKAKLLAAALALAFFAAPVSAQENSTNTTQANQTQVKPNPGLIGPGSAFYGLDTAWDSIGMKVGLKKAQDVAAERASEALAAAEKNNTKGAQKALKHLSDLANKTNITEPDGTSKALQILGQVKQEVPEEAMKGIETAMQNIQKKVPQQIPIPNGGNKSMRGGPENRTSAPGNRGKTNQTSPQNPPSNMTENGRTGQNTTTSQPQQGDRQNQTTDGTTQTDQNSTSGGQGSQRPSSPR
ncbi:hypothetical protein GKQ38_00030 [Candidatus Nanohaloarchaea archaeon]|nr:hypothetical protein GKQ38_00030 [Candidatus Nanohaloarchaea archaeon]